MERVLRMADCAGRSVWDFATDLECVAAERARDLLWFVGCFQSSDVCADCADVARFADMVELLASAVLADINRVADALRDAEGVE